MIPWRQPFALIDRLLRASPTPSVRDRVWPGVLLVVFCGGAYGAMMGLFGGLSGDRSLQVIFSAVKVPLLILVTTALALPSFYVLNALLGLSADFQQAARAVAATQTVVAIVLASRRPTRPSGTLHPRPTTKPCSSTCSCSLSPACRPSGCFAAGTLR